MVAMSRTAKSAIFYSIIGIAIVMGVILLLVDTEILVRMFQLGVNEDNDNNNNPLADRPFRYEPFTRRYWLSAKKEHMLPRGLVENHRIHLNGI
jgi:hypothetical protein